MDNFKYIYRILKLLEKSMDLEEFDPELIGYKELDIIKPRWSRIVSMLKEQEYIPVSYTHLTLPTTERV